MKAFRVAVLLLAILLTSARAASLDGIELPDTREVNDRLLQLNGIALRTYSLFRVPIYVAGLYLERLSSDADTILRSPETKLLDIHFVHDVDAEKARNAWRQGFENNCMPPCRLDPQMVARFLAAVGPLQRGSHSTLTFTPGRVAIELDGRNMGTVDDPVFAWVILSSFIGAHPPTERVRRGLLGDHPGPAR